MNRMQLSHGHGIGRTKIRYNNHPIVITEDFHYTLKLWRIIKKCFALK